MYKLFVGFRKLDEFPTILEAKRFARECDYTGVFTLIGDNYRDSWYKFNDNNKTTAMNNSINKNGISVCQAGEEKYVYFNLTPRPRRKGRYCQYDYRDPMDGELFATVAPTLEQCREKRDKWLNAKKNAQ